MTQLLKDLQTEIQKDPTTNPSLNNNVLDIEHLQSPDTRSVLEDDGKKVKVKFIITMRPPYFPPSMDEGEIQKELDNIYDSARKTPGNPALPEYAVVKNGKVTIILDDSGHDVDSVIENIDKLSKRTTQILRFLFQRLGTMHTCNNCGSCDSDDV
ncbi:hypothetical protein D6777_03980 [Candidatus Woesearchaeota archaeon]|nr:MAG: hypothetical protein D6777_03980 [Candidatus Woesearchaeota archaeon]